TYVRKFTNMRFEPAGMTDDPDIRIAQSVVDYIFRRLALDYLPEVTRREIGILTAAERAAQVNGYGTAGGDEEADVEGMRASAPIEAPAERTAAPATPASGGRASAVPLPAHIGSSTEF